MDRQLTVSDLSINMGGRRRNVVVGTALSVADLMAAGVARMTSILLVLNQAVVMGVRRLA
ncbi:MAG: hypothetical protein R3C68_06390 [Myxococcota bacterium]